MARYSHQAEERLERMMEEQPLAMGAVAFAVGAALGGLLPNTRRENELLGPYAERARSEGMAMARQEAEKARRVAEAAANEATRMGDEAAGEADRKSPSGDEMVREGERKAGEAADRIGEAARSEAERQRLGQPNAR
jgi:hypothetical protein